MNKKIFQSEKGVSGLAVKFDVAIVEPPVRLRANAFFLSIFASTFFFFPFTFILE